MIDTKTAYIEEQLATLNNVLREELIDTRRLDIGQWNEKGAPKLSALANAVQGVSISARTYRLPDNYFGDPEKLLSDSKGA